MPMVHGLSGSTSPMASTSTNTHHDQMTAHYHQYTAYDAAREAGPSSSAVASSSRLTIPQPQHSHPRQLYNTNGRDWPSEHQSSSATPTASSSIAMPSATSSPHYSNSDRSLSNAAVTSESSLSQQTPSTTPSSSLALPPPNMPTTAASLMREGPRDFTVIKDVGDGSFGTVCLADWKSPLPSGTLLSPMQHPTTRPEYLGKRLVAIKKMKKPFPNWEECIKLKELKVRRNE
jgi:meiosis induction protein kinase IME2/SME1